MSSELVVILMGSKADLEFSQKIAEAVRSFSLDVALQIGSAHKTPRHVMEILEQYEQDPRPKVYITVAGRSNALSGFTDGAVSSPVIACPPYSEAFGGSDIFSSLRMPSGISPALVLEPINAALMAAKIFALSNLEIKARVISFQKAQALKIISDNETIK